MKKKHRLEKFFTSVFGTHIDNENSDTLPSKEDVEKDVERILKILRTEDNGSLSSENSFDRSELASHLEGFLNGYKVVHGRYNHLLGKITDKFRPKSGGKGSFSIDFSSSDSESSESGSEEFSDKKKSSKRKEDTPDQVSIEAYNTLQQQLESANMKNIELETMASTMRTELGEGQTLAATLQERDASILTLNNGLQTMSNSVQVLQAERDVLKREVETLLVQGDDMNKKITSMQEENAALRSAHGEAFSKIHEMEKSVEYFQVKHDQTRDEMKIVEFENRGLKEELEMITKEVETLTQQLKTTSEEEATLRLGNFTLLSRMQEAEKALADLRDQNQNLELATEEVTSKNESLSSENGNLKFRLEAADQQNFDLIQRVSLAEDEISFLKSEILRSSSQIQEAEKTIEVMTTDLANLNVESSKLLNMNNDLNQQLKVKEVENETLASEQSKTVEVIQQAEEKTLILSREIETVKDLNSQLLVDYENTKLQLEATNQDLSELKLVLEATEDEKQSLVTQNSDLVNKIQQAEKVIDDFRAETEQLGISNSQMEIKMNSLSLELHEANLQSTNLNKALEAAQEEKEILTLQSSEVLIKFQQAESNMKQLETELEHLREDNSMMLQNQIKLEEAENVIGDLKAETGQLKADNSLLKTNVSNLDLELKASTLLLTEQNTKLEQLQEENSTLEHNHGELQSQKLDLEVMLDGKLSEVLSLQKELEAVREEAASQIKAFAAQVDDLQRERNLLNNQKKDFDDCIASLTLRSVEDQELIKNLQDELKSRMQSEQVTLEVQKNSFDELLGNYKKLEDRFQESCEVAERKAEELQVKEEKLQILEANIEKQKKELHKLEVTHKVLSEKLTRIEAEKVDAAREMASLNKQVERLEVQICLSNQKLKITETENKAKEESYKIIVEALREECTQLKGQSVGLSGRLDALEKELRQLKSLAEVQISVLNNEYGELESVFKENSGVFLCQLSECSKALKVLTKLFVQLKNERQELTVRLKYKEGIMSMMKDKVESIEDKLANTERELEITRTKADESEKRIQLLEEMLGEKKKEVSDKDEAKREAIRQLCLLIEYHRENCTYLSQYLNTVLKRSHRSS